MLRFCATRPNPKCAAPVVPRSVLNPAQHLQCAASPCKTSISNSRAQPGWDLFPPLPSRWTRLHRRTTSICSKSLSGAPSPPLRTHVVRLYLAILAPRCPSRRQVGRKIRIRTPLEPILRPTSPNIGAKTPRQPPPRPPKEPKTIKKT